MKTIVLTKNPNPGASLRINDKSRIIIVGISGSGKSTLAKTIARKAGIARIELDRLFWKANWQKSTDQEFRAKITESLSGKEGFVIDGNYSRFRDLTWGICDTIIWLDYPKAIVLFRLIRRTLHRICTRKPLWHNNIENARNAFLSKDSILLYAWNSFKKVRRLYSRLDAHNCHSIKQCIIIRNPRNLSYLLTCIDN